MTDSNHDLASDLVSDLLDKCEVNQIPAFYAQKLQETGGILPVKLMYSFHPRFTPETVIQDEKEQDEILLIAPAKEVVEHLPIRPGYKNDSQFLLNQQGLIKCLKRLLPRQNPLEVEIRELIATFGIEKASKDKFERMIRQISASQSNLGLRRLVVHEDSQGILWIKYGSVLSDPKKRIQLLQLLFAIVAGILIIVIFTIYLQGLHVAGR